MNDFTVKAWGITPDGTELISGKDAQAIITLLSSEIQAITKHNHALAAQVESCNDALKALLKSLPWIGGSLQADGQFYYKVAESVFEKAQAVLSTTPSQCLAEVRAEAGRAGFIAGATRWNACDAFWDFVPAEKIEKSANEYAESVRKGGE